MGAELMSRKRRAKLAGRRRRVIESWPGFDDEFFADIVLPRVVINIPVGIAMSSDFCGLVICGPSFSTWQLRGFG